MLNDDTDDCDGEGERGGDIAGSWDSVEYPGGAGCGFCDAFFPLNTDFIFFM